MTDSFTTGPLQTLLSRLHPIEEEFPDVDEGIPALDDIEIRLASEMISKYLGSE